MKRLFFVALVLVATLPVALAPVAAVPAPANNTTATPTPSTTTLADLNSTPTPTPTPTATATATPAPSPTANSSPTPPTNATGNVSESVVRNVTLDLSPTIRISGWTYTDGRFRVQVHSVTYGAVTVTDVGAMADALQEGDGASSTTIDSRSYDLDPGETTTITFRADTTGGMAAISIGASNGDVAVLRTDDLSTGGNPPVAWGTAQALIAMTAFGTSYSTYRWVSSRYEDEDQEVERTR